MEETMHGLTPVYIQQFTHLGDIGQQVIGYTLRVLSYQARQMSSNWIEITQQHCIPVLLNNGQLKNHTYRYTYVRMLL